MAQGKKGRAPSVLRYDLTGKTGVSCRSFAIRETTGIDEEQAAEAAKMKGGSVSPTEEIVRTAIVEVDGKPVKQPFLQFDTWTSRTRAFAMHAWQQLNAVNAKELESFLKGGELVDGDVFTVPSPPDEESDEDFGEDGSE